MDGHLLLRRRGFTLTEAVVLIGIIGILGGAVAPRFMEMSSFEAAQAQRETLSDLRFAQRLAASSGCPVQIDFEPTGYVLTQRNACRTGAFGQALPHPSTNQAPYSVLMPSGTTVTSDVDPLVFDALGRASTAAGVTSDAIVSVDGRDLAVVGETGLVHVP